MIDYTPVSDFEYFSRSNSNLTKPSLTRSIFTPNHHIGMSFMMIFVELCCACAICILHLIDAIAFSIVGSSLIISCLQASNWISLKLFFAPSPQLVHPSFKRPAPCILHHGRSVLPCISMILSLDKLNCWCCYRYKSYAEKLKHNDLHSWVIFPSSKLVEMKSTPFAPSDTTQCSDFSIAKWQKGYNSLHKKFLIFLSTSFHLLLYRGCLLALISSQFSLSG